MSTTGPTRRGGGDHVGEVGRPGRPSSSGRSGPRRGLAVRTLVVEHHPGCGRGRCRRSGRRSRVRPGRAAGSARTPHRSVQPWEKITVIGASTGPDLLDVQRDPSSAATDTSGRPAAGRSPRDVRDRPTVRVQRRCAARYAAERRGAEDPVTTPTTPSILPEQRSVLIDAAPHRGLAGADRPGVTCCRSRPLVPTSARHPRTDPGDDLVADRAAGRGPVLRGRLAAVARPEDEHLVAGRRPDRHRSRRRTGPSPPARRSAGACRRASTSPTELAARGMPSA